jgi:probable HAF family extracellular repeat protein
VDRLGGMQDLGTLPGGTVSSAAAINDLGQVSGTGYTTAAFGLPHAFRWTPSGGMQDLGTLPGGTISNGWAINDLGQVSGSADTADGSRHAFRWSPFR